MNTHIIITNIIFFILNKLGFQFSFPSFFFQCFLCKFIGFLVSCRNSSTHHWYRVQKSSCS